MAHVHDIYDVKKSSQFLSSVFGFCTCQMTSLRLQASETGYAHSFHESTCRLHPLKRLAFVACSQGRSYTRAYLGCANVKFTGAQVKMM